MDNPVSLVGIRERAGAALIERASGGEALEVEMRGEPHPVAAHLDLARFAEGRTMDERGIGPFPYAH